MLPMRNVACPYCGEQIELIVDDSIESQRYIEDCSVCCRPIEVDVSADEDGEIRVSVSSDIE